MAKLSTIVKNQKKKKMIAQDFEKRAKLRKMVVDESLSEEAREEAMFKLNRMRRNGCHIRYRNRCVLTGRGRGCYREFGLSRIKFRELALQGIIPGVKKASW